MKPASWARLASRPSTAAGPHSRIEERPRHPPARLQKRAGLPRRIEEHSTIREKIPTTMGLPLSCESKRVLHYAAEEADRLHHAHRDSEHLLLGVLRKGGCFAAQLMRVCGASLKSARKTLAEAAVPSASKLRNTRREQSKGSLKPVYTEEVIERFIAQKLSDATSEQPGFEKYTDRARFSVFLSKHEALREGSETVETEHLFRGLLRLPGVTNTGFYLIPFRGLPSGGGCRATTHPAFRPLLPPFRPSARSASKPWPLATKKPPGFSTAR